MTYKERVHAFEMYLIAQALKASKNRSQAARILGMNRTTLVMRIKALGLKNIMQNNVDATKQGMYNVVNQLAVPPSDNQGPENGNAESNRNAP